MRIHLRFLLFANDMTIKYLPIEILLILEKILSCFFFMMNNLENRNVRYTNESFR